MSNREGRRWNEPVPKPRSNETEVVAAPEHDRRQRRRFSPEERERILHGADACNQRGELGKLLRREGVYSSQLSKWRALREREGVAGLSNKRPGPKPSRDAKDRRIEELEKVNAKLQKELRISKALIELQEKAHEILGLALPRTEDAESVSQNSLSSAPTRFP
jgi:transposase-like protein